MANITNLYMNWSSVTVAAGSGSAATIKHVTDVKINGQSTTEAFYGDARQFAAMIRPVQTSRTLEITTGDVGAIMALDPAAVYTVVATLKHAESGTLTVTLVNAVLKQNPMSGQNNKYSVGSLTFEAYADASDTDPLTVAIA